MINETQITNQLYDITVVGGGPIGMYAAFYAQLRRSRTKIIEALPALGGQPLHLYPAKLVNDLPAMVPLTGKDLSGQLVTQLSKQAPSLALGERAEAIQEAQLSDGRPYFTIQTNQGVHYSRAVILAIGHGSFTPRKLDLEDAAQFERKSLHYYVQDPETFRGRRVAILGGGDSAVDWALMLADIADEVYLVHRRTRFRALEANVSRLNETQVQQVTPFLPARLIGDQGQVQQLLVEEVRGDQVRQLAVDDVIVSYGFSTSMSGIKHWGLEIDRQRIQVDDHLRTNRPGIYAVGDIALYPGKTRNLISGFGEVPRLIGQVMKDLNQEVNLDY